MAKGVSWFKWLMLAGTIGEKYNEAIMNDGKVTFEEALAITSSVCKSAGIEFDDKGSQLVVDLVTAIINAASDGVLSVKEMLVFVEDLCDNLGIELDKTGVNV